MKICIVTSDVATPTQTFVKAHIDYFANDAIILHGGKFPTKTGKGEIICRTSGTICRVAKKVFPWSFPYSSPLSSREVSLGKFLKKERVKVVLAEFGDTGAEISNTCANLGIPLVVYFYGYDAYKLSTIDSYRSKYAHMFETAKKILAVSRAMVGQLESLGAPARKLIYLPCGVNLSDFTPVDAGKNPPVFVSVGRFVDKKAPYLTLLAFKKTLENVPEARLKMIGDGLLLETCQWLAKALLIDDCVEFLGNRKHREMASIMSGCRAFVQHSIRPLTGKDRGNSEGTPLAILEASAKALAVIATSHGGITDVVTHGQTGLLIREGDTDSMAKWMVQVARDRDLATNLGRQARANIEKHFSQEDTLAELKNILQSVSQQN